MFDQHFEVFLADTPEARDLHFRLRYEVYCTETGWEDPSLFPDQMESDEYDDAAVAFLVRRRKKLDWMATMRLVVGSIDELPVSGHARIETERMPPAARARIGEFSRLCLLGKYRRQPGRSTDEAVPIARDMDDSFLQSANRMSESWIMLGLIRAAYAYSRVNAIDYWIFLVADGLARIIRRSGFDIEPIGPAVEHRGLRRPYLFDVVHGAENMNARAPHAHAMFHRRPAYDYFSGFRQHAIA
jgi:N-acyl amino acid synthase of PEP-CTERM/exosortase system